MGRYLARRLLVAVPTLLALSLFIFTLVSLAPGDPAEDLVRRRSSTGEGTAAEIEQVRHELGLDRPFVVQYARWLNGARRGDLGMSFSKRTPVFDEIRNRMLASAELAAAAFLLIVIAAVPLGVAAALLSRHWADHLMRLAALVGASVPSFFLAYLLIILFATRLRLLPVAGREGLQSLVLPAVVLAVTPTAVVSRLLRSSLLEVLGEDYVRSARSNGLTQLQVVVRHGLRNAAIPVVTYLGTALGHLLEGVVITEVIFAWPGLGSLTYEAISQRDYPMVQAVVLLAGCMYVLVNLLVDLSYRLVDPRIRLEVGREHV
ncbi:MAG: ABC transporter permease [Actinomycetota bacterium]|nr:ABC transporter permease [Actinomycetota bacterium]